MIKNVLSLNDKIDTIDLIKQDKLTSILFDPSINLLDEDNELVTSDVSREKLNVNFNLFKGSYLGFDFSYEEIKDYFDKIPKSTTPKQLIAYFKFISENVNLTQAQSRIIPYELQYKNVSEVSLTLITINKMEKLYNLPIIPIKIKDSNNNLVINDIFTVNIKDKPNKISVYNLDIPINDINATEFDISQWKVEFK